MRARFRGRKTRRRCSVPEEESPDCDACAEEVEGIYREEVPEAHEILRGAAPLSALSSWPPAALRFAAEAAAAAAAATAAALISKLPVAGSVPALKVPAPCSPAVSSSRSAPPAAAAAKPASSAARSDDSGGGGGTPESCSRGVWAAEEDAETDPRLAANSALRRRYLYALQWRWVLEQLCTAQQHTLRQMGHSQSSSASTASSASDMCTDRQCSQKRRAHSGLVHARIDLAFFTCAAPLPS